MTTTSPLFIANGQGLWGDSILGPVRLVREGPRHYLTLDYLAEAMRLVSFLTQKELQCPKPYQF